MVDERLVPAGIWKQVQRAHRCLADPACAEREVDFQVAIAWGALIELIHQGSEWVPESAEEAALNQQAGAAYAELESTLLHAHDQRSEARYVDGSPALALCAKLEDALVDVRGLTVIVIELDEPDWLPASVITCVSALRHMSDERYAVALTDASRQAHDRLAAVMLSLQLVRDFWRRLFEIMFVAGREPRE